MAVAEAVAVGLVGGGMAMLAGNAMGRHPVCRPRTALAFGVAGLMAIVWTGVALVPGATDFVAAFQAAFFALVGLAAFLFTADVAYKQRVRLERSLAGERAKARELDEKDQLYRTVLNGTPVILFALDADRRVRLAEGMALRQVGLPPEGYEGRRVDALLADHPGARAAVDDALAGNELHASVSFGGRMFDTTLSPLRDARGRVVRVLGLAVDITERHRKEEAEREGLRQRLEIERLQEMDSFKTRLLNTASHELNTPITPLMLQLHTLKAGLQDSMTPQQKRAVDVLDRNVRRLADLVKDVLEVARLQSGTFRVNADIIRLRPVLEDVIETYRPAAEEKGITVRLTGDDVTAWADPDRIHQVVANLLTNALRFTPRGGEVTVHVAGEPYKILVEVADTGAGLTPKQMEHLFQPFSQVHDPQKHPVGGSGLGLYICKGIVDESGGRIGCDSDGPGKGSVFWFTLPREDPLAPRVHS